MIRPALGVITQRPEEPYVNSTSTVLWELGAGNRPWLPDPPSYGLRPSNLIWPNWASMVLDPFAETKGSRLPGRDPASINEASIFIAQN